MRGGIVLLSIGLFIGWLAVSGKYCCLGQMWDCASSDKEKPCDCGCTGGQTGVSNSPSLNDSLQELLKPLDVPGIGIFPYSGGVQAPSYR